MTAHHVTPEDTAEALGSGDVPVLGTPRLVAWMEAETLAVAAARLGPGQTTVGAGVRIRHRRPSAVGDTVEVVAAYAVPPVGRTLTFRVDATDARGNVLAHGEIDRVVVDRARFLHRG